MKVKLEAGYLERSGPEFYICIYMLPIGVKYFAFLKKHANNKQKAFYLRRLNR